MFSLSYLHHERRLLPQRKCFLRLCPVLRYFRQLQVEAPQDLCQDQPHFMVCQIATDAVPGPYAEWLECFSAVIEKWRVRVRLCCGQPPLRVKGFGVVEVGFGMVGGKMVHSDASLQMSQ